MYEGKSVAVVVPAYNEEPLIASTVSTIPDFVDRIIVVDDASTDATVEKVKAADPRVDLIEHERNQGVGAAIVTGYKRAIAEEIEITAVMAADGQMDPDDLEALVQGIVSDQVDYAKANRLFTGQAWELIPRTRYLGNAVLSFLTKIASGYWHVADSQSGYTAVNLETLKLLDLDRVYKRYGFPNDLLVHLNVWNRRVRDYPSRPIYGVGERSGIRLRHVVPKISWLLTKGFFWRMKEKYIIRDFIPSSSSTRSECCSSERASRSAVSRSACASRGTRSRAPRSSSLRCSSSLASSSCSSPCGSTWSPTKTSASRSGPRRLSQAKPGSREQSRPAPVRGA